MSCFRRPLPPSATAMLVASLLAVSSLGCDSSSSSSVDGARPGSDSRALDAGPAGDGGAARDSVDPCVLGLCGDGAPVAGRPTGGAWKAAAKLPAPQQECAVIALGGVVYVIGGFGAGSSLLSRVLAYDVASDRWRDVAALPAAMHHVNAAAHGGKIYVLGTLRGFAFSAHAGSYVFDPQKNTWTPVASMPSARRRGGGVAVTVGDRIYVFGGLRGGAVRDADYYDVKADTWHRAADLPAASDHLGGGAIDGAVYLVGGRGGTIASHTTRLLRYDPGADKYTTLAPMPTSRGGLAATVLGGKLYVFGGEGNRQHPSGVFDDNEVYDPKTNAWRALSPLGTRRHGTGAAAVDGRIVVPGGADKQAFGAIDVNEVFTP